MHRFLVVLLFFIALPATAETAPWESLREPGHVALIRHANAPGPSPDPPGFDLQICETQRNLDDAGRNEAAALGERMRAEGIVVGRLLSSAWCRCQETARLLGFGDATVEPALNNTHAGLGDPETQIPALRVLISTWQGPGALVLVSHGSTIRRLTGAYPSQGEVFVLKPEPGSETGFVLLGRMKATP